MVGGVRAEETQSNIIFPSALPRLKLFVWISLIPTYNSGIEQHFNYTKHFGKKTGGRGGLQMWKNSFCLLRPLFFILGWMLDFGLFRSSKSHDSWFWKKQGIGNVDYSKILLAWIVTSFFFGLESDFIYIQDMDQWDTLAYWVYKLWLDGGLVRLLLRIDSSTFGLE